MRREAATQREAAAAWRIERQSLLKLHASWADQAGAAAREHASAESQLMEQHELLLSQQRQLHDERAARVAEQVSMRGLQAEVRSLEAQLDRAAAEHASQRQQLAVLQQTLAMHGVPGGRAPPRPEPAPPAADADAASRAAEEGVAGCAALTPAPAGGAGGPMAAPANVVDIDPDAVLWWSNPAG